jgi:4-hydroxybenzoate polyprenyltransferase/phosphoserine phosphatase
MEGPRLNAAVPLCVDLDGTLVRTDMLFESLVAALRRNPLVAFLVPFWLMGGRANLKQHLARHAPFDPAVLPYDEDLVALLRRERAAGRRILLATASDVRIAEAIARHLGVFDEVVASDGRRNLKAGVKAAHLAERFGERGFDYIGNGAADVPVWSRARTAYLVAGRPGMAQRVAAAGAEVRHLERRRGAPWPLVRVLRVHQWAKNLLVFVPLLTAHRLADPQAVNAALLAFVAFSFAASATYILNDLADLEHDRRHPGKRRRALASGELPVWVGTVLAPQLLLLAFVVALPLPPLFLLELGCYTAATVAYSLWLKRIVLVDVFMLAGLYAVRILAGAAAIEVPVSHWLLVFSLFMFLSLALAKRFTELSGLAKREGIDTPGRGYRAVDRAPVGIFGAATGTISVLVFALYITSPEVRVLYARPELLWMACPILLYWVTRVWLLAYRDELHEDPVIFALRDPVSLALGVATFASVLAAT